MASYTPNLNLYKPDDSDDYKDFREGFNDNMDILDQGGGGGDSVSYTQTLATGAKVGAIEINGTSQDINAPTFNIQAYKPYGGRTVYLRMWSQELLVQTLVDTAEFTPWLEIDENGIPLCVWEED
jgi:hypothetical protein